MTPKPHLSDLGCDKWRCHCCCCNQLQCWVTDLQWKAWQMRVTEHSKMSCQIRAVNNDHFLSDRHTHSQLWDVLFQQCCLLGVAIKFPFYRSSSTRASDRLHRDYCTLSMERTPHWSSTASSDTVSCTFTYHTWQFIIIIFTIFTITTCIFSYSFSLSF